MKVTQKRTLYLLSFFVWAGLLSGSFLGQQATPTPAANTTAQLASPPDSSLAATSAQPLKTPEEFFARARQLSDLEAAGVPFHLKATFVATGDAEYTGNGTFEEWWRSENVWRKEATLGKFTYTAVQNGKTSIAYATSRYIPLRLRQASDAVVLRVPPNNVNSDDWSMENNLVRGQTLIVFTRKIRGQKKYRERDYFTPDAVLRMRGKGLLQVNYNQFRAFHGLSVPRNIVMYLDNRPIVKASVTSLEALQPNESKVFEDAPIATRLQRVAFFAHGIPYLRAKDLLHQTRLIHQENVSYPWSAKWSGKQGVVVINASIDDKGNVREPYVIVSGGSSLDHAALKSIRKWKYAPLEANGTPYSVDTTVEFDFSLHR